MTRAEVESIAVMCTDLVTEAIKPITERRDSLKGCIDSLKHLLIYLATEKQRITNKIVGKQAKKFLSFCQHTNPKYFYNTLLIYPNILRNTVLGLH